MLKNLRHVLCLGFFFSKCSLSNFKILLPLAAPLNNLQISAQKTSYNSTRRTTNTKTTKVSSKPATESSQTCCQPKEDIKDHISLVLPLQVTLRHGKIYLNKYTFLNTGRLKSYILQPKAAYLQLEQTNYQEQFLIGGFFNS